MPCTCTNVLLPGGLRPLPRCAPPGLPPCAPPRRTSLTRYYAMRCQMAEQALAKLEVCEPDQPLCARGRRVLRVWGAVAAARA
jgi:hypothetical protein